VVVSGDLVDWADSDRDWADFRESTRELRAKTAYLPAPGNHDVSDHRRFEKEFGLEKSYYEKRIGDVHLFLLDSNGYFREPEPLAWLEEKAAASDARHKIAVFHHPPFSIDTWGDFETRAIRERLHPVLVRLKFCAAFCGHNHHFYTTRRDGVRYVITAGGGAPLYPIDPERAQEGDLFRKFHHFVGARIRDKRIEARVFDPDGRDVPELAFTVCEH
jgi:3',5'-cyclic AMP phosphodiesterase CpdA